jgi:hypothetical protein
VEKRITITSIRSSSTKNRKKHFRKNMPITRDDQKVLESIFIGGNRGEERKMSGAEMACIARGIYKTILHARDGQTLPFEKLAVLGKLVFANVQWEQFPEELKKELQVPFYRSAEEYLIPEILKAFAIVEPVATPMASGAEGALDSVLSESPPADPNARFVGPDGVGTWHPSEETKVASASPTETVANDPPVVQKIVVAPNPPAMEQTGTSVADTADVITGEGIVEGEVGGPGTPEEDAMLIERAATEAALEAKAQKALENAQKAKETAKEAAKEDSSSSKEVPSSSDENPIP